MGGMFFTSLQTCFFRQFGRSVDRSDYLTLRKVFIVVGDTLCRMIISFFHSHFQLFMNDNNDTTTIVGTVSVSSLMSRITTSH